MIASFRTWRPVARVALTALAFCCFGCSLFWVSVAQGLSLSADTMASSVATGAALPAPHRFDTRLYLGKPLYSVTNSRHEVALTFDDGPSDSTLAIVRILQRYHAHATFFFVGDRAGPHPGPVDVLGVLRAGDDVGNHTWTHVDLKGLSSKAVDHEISATQSELGRIDGELPTFVRPRGGKFDAVGLSEATRLGLILTLWSVDGYDYVSNLSPDTVVHNATAGVKAGSIIDLHDHHPATVRALPAILDRLRRDGLHAVTLSQLLADSTPSTAVPAYFQAAGALHAVAMSTAPFSAAPFAGYAASNSAESSRGAGSLAYGASLGSDPASAPGGALGTLGAGAAESKPSRFDLTLSLGLAIGGTVLAVCIIGAILILRGQSA